MNNLSFIKHVANDLLEKNICDLSKLVVVFPNKRAALFMNKALAEATEIPIWSPEYITINELFLKYSEKNVADELQLLCILYHSYRKITGSRDSLDDFFSWGQTLLADFDDIDKNLADARQVFRNISNLHERDTTEFLCVNQ